jgi:DNA-damage-inducible protein D
MSEEQRLTFEDYGNENGSKYWWGTDYCKMLGYSSMASFIKGPINKAIQSCMAANIEFHNEFRRETRVLDGNSIDDFKLSRFACYMIAMNGDSKKPQVARAQVYFADQVEKINLILEGAEDIKRIEQRDELKIRNVSLNSAAKLSGVSNFAFFHDAGYRGLYNQGIKQLKTKKGLKPSADHFDYMGSTELAANLFRIALTEERLKTQGIQGEANAQNVHRSVGKQIRKMVQDNTGQDPENLPVERRLGDVKKELKKATKKLNSKKD